jgi:hypothetical protein
MARTKELLMRAHPFNPFNPWLKKFLWLQQCRVVNFRAILVHFCAELQEVRPETAVGLRYGWLGRRTAG